MEADSKLHDVAAVFGIGVVAPEMGNKSMIKIKIFLPILSGTEE